MNSLARLDGYRLLAALNTPSYFTWRLNLCGGCYMPLAFSSNGAEFPVADPIIFHRIGSRRNNSPGPTMVHWGENPVAFTSAIVSVPLLFVSESHCTLWTKLRPSLIVSLIE